MRLDKGAIKMYRSWGFVILGAYLILMLLTRWLFVARKEIVSAAALVQVARNRLPSLWDRDIASKHKDIHAAIQQLIEYAYREIPQSYRAGMLFWNGSHQIASSTFIHEAERQSVWLMPHDLVVARLTQITGQLNNISEPRRSEWRSTYKALMLENGGTESISPDQMTRNRVFLSEFLGEQYRLQDSNAVQLFELYNKTFWLINISLVPIAALVGLGYALVLAAGAVGGIISRMQRVVFAKHVPTSFGSSWMPLFCAPILGALGAWAGLALLRLLQVLGIANLSDILPDDRAVTNPTLPILALATLFGLSERFLNTIGEQAQAALNVTYSIPVPGTDIAPIVSSTPGSVTTDSDGQVTSR